MTEADDWKKANPKTSPEIIAAAEYLERHGLLFGRDFGLGDAVDKAGKLMGEWMDQSWYEEFL